MKEHLKQTIFEYVLLTAATTILVVGVYVFKFPNNFSFGGVTGMAVILSAILPFSPTSITNVINVGLLALGFLFLGRTFGVKTVFVTGVNTLELWLLDRSLPLTAPITNEPVLELAFAVLLPAVSSAIMFNVQASSGGTDILAMILRKYTDLNIGTSLMITDSIVVLSTFFIFGPETGLFSVAGLIAKTLIIDGAIESINLCKFFTIICDEPKPIVEFIHEELGRSATVEHAEGTYLHRDKTVILVVTKRRQAVLLRNFVRQQEPGAFMMITNSSEIIGKGFRGFN